MEYYIQDQIFHNLTTMRYKYKLYCRNKGTYVL